MRRGASQKRQHALKRGHHGAAQRARLLVRLILIGHHHGDESRVIGRADAAWRILDRDRLARLHAQTLRGVLSLL